MVRNYEVALLLREGETLEATLKRVKDYLANAKGNLVGDNNMGNRQLAYPIRKNREDFFRAFYYFMKVEAESTILPEFERHIKIDNDVIRYMVLVEE